MSAPTYDKTWPPQSARQALLSSPSGTKQYANFQPTNGSSPIKRKPGTPSLLDRLRLARNGQDQVIIDESGDQEEDEDDEETLQLKIAAIEAKLKLKKLQNKSKKEEQASSSRPTSAGTASMNSYETTSATVQVTLSPIKRPQPMIEQKSPSRIMLGIDKGVRGADVSLRRAKTVGGSPSKLNKHASSDMHGSVCKTTTKQYARNERPASAAEVKSFNERMAESRDNERKQANKREDASKTRIKNFQLDAAEIERFKTAAGESQSQFRSRSPNRNHTSVVSNATAGSDSKQHNHKIVQAVSSSHKADDEPTGDANLFEGFSGLHLSSRILPHSFLKRTLPTDQFTIYKIPDLLKQVTSPAFEVPDEVGDFVVFGIVASKSNPFNQKGRAEDNVKTSSEWEKKWDDGSQNRNKFMVLTLTDLRWTVDLYLFGTALPRYHRLSPGTVIAVLNPSIMPPKQGKEDTGAFSLTLHNGEDTVLEIGTSKDLGFCNAVKKDGKECGQWVNGAKSEICEWHLNAQIAKTRAGRMGLNTGANGFGKNDWRGKGNGSGFGGGNQYERSGAGPSKQGRGFDRESGSQYYVSSSNPGTKATPIYNPNISSAKMIDLDSDDPFIAEGQLSRDKDALIQRRMAVQEKERNIARKLAKLGDGSSAGANYMRRRAENDIILESDRNALLSRKRAAPTADSSTLEPESGRNTPLDLRAEIGKKRAAEDVRLSPVKKKTRFLTEKGIKEAGRESMGSRSIGTRRLHDHDDNDDDDDDDLDII